MTEHEELENRTYDYGLSKYMIAENGGITMEKNNNIITYNINGHRPVNKAITFEQKLKGTAFDIRGTYDLPLIIMLQEMIAGRNMKFLNQLRVLFPEYELILPAGFDYVKHFKSIMSVTLIRRNSLSSYKVEDLDTELPNRICYVAAKIKGVGETNIISSHIVQVQNFKHQADWYIAERRRLHDQQWVLLHEVLHNNKDTNVIFAGDMQECKSSTNLSKLKEQGYIISGASKTKTVRNNFFNEESCIDHIILSPGARSALGKGTEIIYDNTSLGKNSDHTLLCLCS